MFKHIYRQRRRLLFTSFFSSLAVIIILLRDFQHIFDSAPPWVSIFTLSLTVLTFAIAVFIVSAIFILILPSLRNLVELMSLNAFILAALSVLAPTVSGNDAQYWFSPYLPMASFLFIYSISYGPLLDSFPLWVDSKSSRSFITSKPVKELWAEMRPCKAPLDQHYDSLLHDFEPDPEDENSYKLRYTRGHGMYSPMTITYVQDQPYSYSEYHFTGDISHRNSSLTGGTLSIKIAPHPKGGNKVTLTECREKILPHVGLQLWFDDYLGDVTDMILAKHHGKRDWSMSGKYRRNVAKYA